MLFVTADYSKKHLSTFGAFEVMCKGTDIGPLILPHCPAPPIPPFRLAVIIPFSASKSHFGASTYKIASKDGSAKSCCVALLFCYNPNLNCGEPVPTPTGLVLAFNTHVAGMTLGDWIAGFVALILDAGFQALLNKIGSGIGARILGKIAPKLIGKVGEKLFEAGVGFLLGSPMGVDLGFFLKELGLPNVTPFGLLTEVIPKALTGGQKEGSDMGSLLEDGITGFVDGPSSGEQH